MCTVESSLSLCASVAALSSPAVEHTHVVQVKKWSKDQFTDCGLESATLHVHMCTIEELSVIVSIYTYSCILLQWSTLSTVVQF